MCTLVPLALRYVPAVDYQDLYASIAARGLATRRCTSVGLSGTLNKLFLARQRTRIARAHGNRRVYLSGGRTSSSSKLDRRM